MAKILKKKVSSSEQIVLGIDASLNGTAVVKLRGEEILDFTFFTTVKKLAKGFPKNAILNNTTGPERLFNIQNIFSKHILSDNIDYVAIEDYAFGAKSNSVFQIGGLGEMLRLMLYKKRIPYREYEITRIKKFATSGGTAEKSAMVLAAYKDGFDVGKFGKSGEDLADAYWVARMLQEELKLRKDSNYANTIPKYKLEAFYAVTKASPIPILERPFVKMEVN